MAAANRLRSSASGIIGHLTQAKTVIWDQLEATASVLATTTDQEVKQAFVELEVKLEKVLLMHRSTLQNNKIMDVADVGLQVEERAFAEKLRKIEYLTKQIISPPEAKNAFLDPRLTPASTSDFQAAKAVLEILEASKMGNAVHVDSGYEVSRDSNPSSPSEGSREKPSRLRAKREEEIHLVDIDKEFSRSGPILLETSDLGVLKSV
ncbi:hypothetical protein AAMO2058_001111600 [Amorphochlora amoebiformis]